MTHWGGNTRLRSTYGKMIQKCYNPNCDTYKYYGGRGIYVCDEWRNNPSAFIEWALKNGYDDRKRGHENSIDRIDNNGPYSPDNCRWVGMDVQAKNRRRGVNEKFRKSNRPKKIWTIDGVQVEAVELCKIFGKDYANVYKRMKKYNLTPMQALLLPETRGGRRDQKKYWIESGFIDQSCLEPEYPILIEPMNETEA